MFNVIKNKGFAKLDVFEFTTDVIDDGALIDFGDGNIKSLNGKTNFEHTYNSFGVFVAEIRRCGESEALPENCLNVFIEPFVKDAIELVATPLSSYSSKDSGTFQLCLSSNCPPPLKVKLSMVGSQVPHISEIDDDYLFDCKPKRYFKDSNGVVLKDDLLIFENPSHIFVNDLECGYRDFGEFSFYSDDVGDLEICAELINDCFGCKNLSIDYEDCLLSGDITLSSTN